MSVTLKVIFKNRLNDRKCSLEQGEIQSPRRKIPNDLGQGYFAIYPAPPVSVEFPQFYDKSVEFKKNIPSDYIHVHTL